MKNQNIQIIVESKSSNKEYFKDLILFRELFYFFAWRDIIVRYKQALLGITWTLIKPLLNMVFFALLFGKIAKLPSDNVNYSLFVLAGLIPWQLFSNSMIDSSNSIVNYSHMITKVYFPRILITASAVAVLLVDFFISILFLLILSLILGGLCLKTLLFLPLFTALALVLCLGAGFWLSALTVRYRDFRFILPFIAQIGMFISPVGYGSFVISDEWKYFYYLNPMTGIIDGFRWSFFGISHPFFPLTLGISIIFSVILFISGFFYFRKMERVVADII